MVRRTKEIHEDTGSLATREEQMRKALLVPAAVLMIAVGAPSMAKDQHPGGGVGTHHKDNPTQQPRDTPQTQKGHKDNPTQHPGDSPHTQN